VKEWWDERYKNEQFIWDKGPSKCTESSVEYLKSKGIKKVLDVPCGYGRDSIYLAKNGFEVVGVDRSNEALKLATDWAKNEGLSVNFLEGDISNLEFPDEHFDAIISNRYLHLVHDDEQQKKVAQEMHRVVKDDGLLVLATRSIQDPDCSQDNHVKEKVYELKNRPGHFIRFNTLGELKKLFGHFEEISFEKIEEPESMERTVNCDLIKLIAKK
jgi:ubiquinone/menaquinone biosynthesis C-methylase UbiE